MKLDDLKLEKSEIPVHPYFNDEGMTVLPEGYRWCDDCAAVTHHEDMGGGYWRYVCEVCDNSQSEGPDDCPNCGFMSGEESMDGHVVVRHHPGCHDQHTDDHMFLTHADSVLEHFKESWMKDHRERMIRVTEEDWAQERVRQGRLKLLASYKKMFQCGCPRFTIFQNIHNIVIAGSSYSSMDCINAYWWTYRIRCPVCGCVYDNEGDNC